MTAWIGGITRAVVGGTGRVVGGVVGAAQYVLGEPYPLEESNPDDEPNIYEVRARVDQVLQFFEIEFDRYSPYVEDHARLESLRIEYYNCVNAIEFQCEIIAQLVEELLENRQLLREKVADIPQRKEICIKLAHTKLDISDRKNKRFFKEKERRQLHETLGPLLAEIKTRRFLEEQANAQKPVEDTSTKVYMEAAVSGKAASEFEQPDKAYATEMAAHQNACISRRDARRRYKHYTDEELSSLLHEKDS
eukprot:gnl/TRDRNA2_/TRDRNA2_85246_c0_seq1.p1 gnl/TRDRNA2_/TRDRNA2_85246_c0~~gnl/TRDRNA2_/TRDRNA2_85246_c0_seq1.p1  ORF type:complete len:262 (-),score=58.55 gnl/TRDRNA2_/TRDRNA2_85246_c0_seq1:84-830(-)